MDRIVVFTDLDGTLLDHETYSVRGAVSALDLLARRKIDVVPVTSKTSAEVDRWMKLLLLNGPYVCENGCGISIPEHYFQTIPEGAELIDGQWKLHLGARIEKVRTGLETISRELGFDYRSFGQMDADEITALTGLKGAEVDRCRQREYDEAFVISSEHDTQKVSDAAAGLGLSFTRGGRFYHLAGGCNKGEAVRQLTELYRQGSGPLLTVGIGDSANDLPMLEFVDKPFIVKRPDGSYDPDIPDTVARRVEGIGPAGWRLAIEEVMSSAGAQ